MDKDVFVLLGSQFFFICLKNSAVEEEKKKKSPRIAIKLILVIEIITRRNKRYISTIIDSYTIILYKKKTGKMLSFSAFLRNSNNIIRRAHFFAKATTTTTRTVAAAAARRNFSRIYSKSSNITNTNIQSFKGGRNNYYDPFAEEKIDFSTKMKPLSLPSRSDALFNDNNILESSNKSTRFNSRSSPPCCQNSPCGSCPICRGCIAAPDLAVLLSGSSFTRIAAFTPIPSPCSNKFTSRDIISSANNRFISSPPLPHHQARSFSTASESKPEQDPAPTSTTSIPSPNESPLDRASPASYPPGAKLSDGILNASATTAAASASSSLSTSAFSRARSNNNNNSGSRLISSEEMKILSREIAMLQQLAELLQDVATENEKELVHRGLKQLEELFLVVIVGEFNSGKSSFINALLGDKYLRDGVTPTTNCLHVIKYGSRINETYEEKDDRVIVELPLSFLKDLNVVDTPGTNAIIKRHQEITEEFVPRSDLILFITSVERPFSDSEHFFLERIKNWGKKVILVINKIDTLEPLQLKEVEDFVRQGIIKTLGMEPKIFPVSSKFAIDAKLSEKNSIGKTKKEENEKWGKSKFEHLG